MRGKKILAWVLVSAMVLSSGMGKLFSRKSMPQVVSGTRIVSDPPDSSVKVADITPVTMPEGEYEEIYSGMCVEKMTFAASDKTVDQRKIIESNIPVNGGETICFVQDCRSVDNPGKYANIRLRVYQYNSAGGIISQYNTSAASGSIRLNAAATTITMALNTVVSPHESRFDDRVVFNACIYREKEKPSDDTLDITPVTMPEGEYEKIYSGMRVEKMTFAASDKTVDQRKIIESNIPVNGGETICFVQDCRSVDNPGKYANIRLRVYQYNSAGGIISQYNTSAASGSIRLNAAATTITLALNTVVSPHEARLNDRVVFNACIYREKEKPSDDTLDITPVVMPEGEYEKIYSGMRVEKMTFAASDKTVDQRKIIGSNIPVNGGETICFVQDCRSVDNPGKYANIRLRVYQYNSAGGIISQYNTSAASGSIRLNAAATTITLALNTVVSPHEARLNDRVVFNACIYREKEKPSDDTLDITPVVMPEGEYEEIYSGMRVEKMTFAASDKTVDQRKIIESSIPVNGGETICFVQDCRSVDNPGKYANIRLRVYQYNSAGGIISQYNTSVASGSIRLNAAATTITLALNTVVSPHEARFDDRVVFNACIYREKEKPSDVSSDDTVSDVSSGDTVSDVSSDDTVSDVSSDDTVSDVSSDDTVSDVSSDDTVSDVSSDDTVSDVSSDDTVSDVSSDDTVSDVSSDDTVSDVSSDDTVSDVSSDDTVSDVSSDDTFSDVSSGDTVSDVSSDDTVSDVSSDDTVSDVSSDDTVSDVSSDDTFSDVSSDDTVSDVSSGDTVSDVSSDDTVSDVSSGDTVSDVSSDDTVSDVSSDDTVSDVSSDDTVSDVSSDDTVSDVSSDDTVSDVSSDDTVSDVSSDDTVSDVSSDDTVSDVSSDDTASDVSSDDTGSDNEAEMKKITGSDTRRKALDHGGFFTKSTYQDSPLSFLTAANEGIVFHNIDIVFSADNIPFVSHNDLVKDVNGSWFKMSQNTAESIKTRQLGDSDYSWTPQTLAETDAYIRSLGGSIEMVDVSAFPTIENAQALPAYYTANNLNPAFTNWDDETVRDAFIENGNQFGVYMVCNTADSITSSVEYIRNHPDTKFALNIMAVSKTVRAAAESQLDAFSQLNLTIYTYRYNNTQTNEMVSNVPDWADGALSERVNVNYELWKNANQ